MIKLIRFVPEYIKEAIDQSPPPIVRHIDHPSMSSSHAYNKPASDGAKEYFKGNVQNNRESVIPKAMEVISRFENNKNIKSGGFNRERNKWFPHDSVEGGAGTIAYGHKIKPGEDFSQGITDSEAMDLLRKDTEVAYDKILKHIKTFEGMHISIQIAALNAMFRGDLGPKTMSLISQNQFDKAAKEYLNHQEYRTTSNSGVKKRMEWNANVFQGAA